MYRKLVSLEKQFLSYIPYRTKINHKMNGVTNGQNGHGAINGNGETFLFTSESVGEGHPGWLFSDLI